MKYLFHPLVALAIQLGTYIIFGSWWVGVLAATLAYFFRESTQAEYRWIERYGAGLRANMPWWGPFDPRVWSLKDWTDWIGPLIATTLVAALRT